MARPEQSRIERRSALRFPQYQVPVLLRASDGRTGNGFTLNLCSRGALVWTDFPLSEGESVDMTLVMPAEISTAEEMSVRCRARVMRLQPDPDRGKPAVALRIEHYDFLPRQIQPIHSHAGAELHGSRA